MADSYVGYGPASRISLANASVTVGALATTGTASSSTYLRGDMAWASNPLGDVIGPGSSTDNALAKWDSTTGTLIQNSNATLTDAGVLTVANIAATINTAAQPTITSLGTITGFTSTGIDDNADALAMTITSAENIGIGETVPLGKVHIKSADAGSITPSGNADELVIEGSSGSGISIYSGSTSMGTINFGDDGHDAIGAITYNHNTNDMQFTTNTGTGRITIDTSGYVGLMIDAPTSRLHLYEGSGTGTYMKVENTNGTAQFGVSSAGAGEVFTSTADDLDLKTNSTTRINIDSGGDVSFLDNEVVRAMLKDYSETKQAMAAHDVDLTLGNVQTYTLSGNQTLTFSNPIATGNSSSFTLLVTNGGSATLTWPTAVDWAGATAPSLTSSGIDALVFTTIDGGTIWYGFLAGADLS